MTSTSGGALAFIQNLGMWEIIVIAVVALIVLGPHKLPEAARQIGRFMSEFRKVSQNLQSDFRDAIEDPLLKPAQDLAELAREPAQHLKNLATDAIAEVSRAGTGGDNGGGSAPANGSRTFPGSAGAESASGSSRVPDQEGGSFPDAAEAAAPEPLREQ
ncbi:MAG: Sec-independent protein translocase protein TatB [Acidimicrobiales bacterium]|nr:MAG: twin-arginine translocase subunit TatB [Actinomycetota bacterium]MBV6507263.1 Sec-independent protein translocase protein TatB [Acidimicrobiales bacterium]RIK04127.1 MAG: twin-arginine translocase subunit TatB [Acidobacteriota bacterium]